MTDDDDKLRDEFARLRRTDARRTPSIDVLSRAPKGPLVGAHEARRLRIVALAVIPLVAAAAALLFVCNGPTQSEPTQASVSPPVAAIDVEEPLPLDFLLQTHVASTDLGGSDFLLRTPKGLRGQLP